MFKRFGITRGVGLVLALIIVVHLFLLTKITFFPNSELFIYPYLTNQGLLPYKDILDQHFPGLMFLPLNFDNLGMKTPQAALVVQLVVVAVTQLLMFIAAKRLFKRSALALLGCLLFLVWQPFFEGYIQWLDVFLPLFTLSAFIILIGHKKLTSRDFFLVGIILSLGVVFKQVLIPLAGLVGLYVILSERKESALVAYVAGLVIPVGTMLGYLTLRGVVVDFWYWTVIYNTTVFAEYGRKWIPSWSHLIRVLVVFVPAFLGMLANIKKRNFILLTIFASCSMAAVFARFDFVHLQPALPFVVLGTIAFFQKVANHKRLKFVVVAGYLVVTAYWGMRFYQGNWGSKILFFDADTYKIAQVVSQYVKPGGTIFVYGASTHLYQMTNTLPPGKVFVFQFPWFMSVAGSRVYNGLVADQPKVVVADRTITIDDQPLVAYTDKINAYLYRYYYTVQKIGNVEILILK